jgi:hypothetical protein
MIRRSITTNGRRQCFFKRKPDRRVGIDGRAPLLDGLLELRQLAPARHGLLANTDLACNGRATPPQGGQCCGSLLLG